MLKKISVITISVIIVVFGCIAFQKLNYWERSVRIFSIGNSPESTDRRPGGERNLTYNGEEFRGEGSHRGEESERRLKDVQSGKRQGDFRGGDRHGSEGEGKKINFGKVFLFLAVFASSTVIIICIDKIYYAMRKTP
jgi:hypothetical protein